MTRQSIQDFVCDPSSFLGEETVLKKVDFVSAFVLRVATLFLCLAIVSPSWARAELKVQFISVGQADATLIRCPDADRFMLIDAGDRKKGGYPQSLENFQAHMLAEFKGKPKKLDIVVASHAHSDHIGSMQWVLENFEIGTYLDNGDKGETDTFEGLQKTKNRLVGKGKLEYVNGKKAKSAELTFCPGAGVSVEVFSPWAFSKKLRDANDKSVIVRLDHKKVSFLFVGDAHDKAEKAMMEEMDEALRKKLDVDVLKVGHHGSDTSSTAAFVMAVSPQIAVISSGRMKVGSNVRYKHPRASTITTYANWFKKADQNIFKSADFPHGKIWAYDPDRDWRQMNRPDGVWLTTVDGTIVVRSDGDKLTVSLTSGGKP